MFNWFPTVTKPMRMLKILKNEQANLWEIAKMADLGFQAKETEV